MDELAVREVIEYDDSDGFEERREDSEKVEETTHNGVVNATAKSKRKHHDDSDDKGVNHRRRHQKRRKDDLVGWTIESNGASALFWNLFNKLTISQLQIPWFKV